MSQPINMPPNHGDASKKCGSCQWFCLGFEGKTCQQLRQVVETTRACIEYQPFRQSPFSIIEKDKFLVEMRKTILIWTQTTITQYDREIKQFKITSKDTQLKDPMAYVEEGRLAELSCKFETCNTYQERLLDMRFSIMDKCEELEQYAKDVQAYLFNQYKEYVTNLKNEGERGAFYRAAAPELFKALDKMQTLKEKAEMAQDQLKNAHFALSRKQEAVLELWRARVNSVAAHNRTTFSG